MEENTILIGKKDYRIYIKVINSKLSQTKEVTIKTRGQCILNAINIVSFLQHNKQVSIKNIKLSGSDFEKEGKTRFIPDIEIVLIKK